MADQKINLAAMKKIGMVQQKQKEYFALRLRAVGGDLTPAQFRKVAEVAETYGNKKIHLTTRQGIEIHNVHHTKLIDAKEELAKARISMGACGPRVRVVVACPG
jgi:anaerobic sulfite reductase subunit C